MWLCLYIYIFSAAFCLWLFGGSSSWPQPLQQRLPQIITGASAIFGANTEMVNYIICSSNGPRARSRDSLAAGRVAESSKRFIMSTQTQYFWIEIPCFIQHFMTCVRIRNGRLAQTTPLYLPRCSAAVFCCGDLLRQMNNATVSGDTFMVAHAWGSSHNNEQQLWWTICVTRNIKPSTSTVVDLMHHLLARGENMNMCASWNGQYAECSLHSLG